MAKKIWSAVLQALIVLAVVTVLAAILVPNFIRARARRSYPQGLVNMKAQAADEALLQESKASGQYGSSPAARDKNWQATTSSQADLAQTRLVIKNASLNLVVDNIPETLKKIAVYAEKNHGWIIDSNLCEQSEVPLGGIKIRIPAQDFESALQYCTGLAKRVSNQQVQGQDVTEEYVDLGAKLRNYYVTETQLLKIMNRAGKIPEVLGVLNELSRIREEIETTKGRMAYLEKSSQYSTIAVQLALSEEMLPIPPANRWQPKYVFLTAWRSVTGTLRAISYLIIWLMTYAVIWLPVLLFFWWLKRRKKSKLQ